jgi:hypothetical protein
LDNINIDVGEIGWGGMYWINLGKDRDQWWALVNMLMDLHDQLSFHFKSMLDSSQHVNSQLIFTSVKPLLKFLILYKNSFGHSDDYINWFQSYLAYRLSVVCS